MRAALIVFWWLKAGIESITLPARSGKLLAENGDALFTEGGDNMVYDRG